MARPTQFDRMEDEILNLIARLREKGGSLDKIREHLKEEHDIDVPRSSLARHLQGVDEAANLIRSSRRMAKDMVAEFGDDIDDKTSRLNEELLKSATLKMLVAAASGEKQEFSPAELQQIATTIERTSKARALNSARQIKERERFAAEVAADVVKVAKAHGASGEFLKAINDTVLGKTKPA